MSATVCSCSTTARKSRKEVPAKYKTIPRSSRPISAEKSRSISRVRDLAQDTPLLELKALQVAYGGTQAVKGIDLPVGEGELVCLLGATGAGKTTTLKGITGLQPVKSVATHHPRDNITTRPA